MFTLLPLTEDPWQVFTLDLTLSGDPFHAQVELRFLPAPAQWFLTLRDHASGELLVQSIPLVCSYARLNDLFFPFRHLRAGKGIGSLFCLRSADAPVSPDPASGTLTHFQLLWTDTLHDSF